MQVDPLGLMPLITNKFPGEAMPTDGKVTPFSIEDGKIKGINGQRQFDFVVTKDGELIIGKKHHLLGQGQDVLAAGQMRLNGKGKVNLSGHYRPSVSESMGIPDALRKSGLDVSGATLEITEFKINDEGLIVERKVVHRTICK